MALLWALSIVGALAVPVILSAVALLANAALWRFALWLGYVEGTWRLIAFRLWTALRLFTDVGEVRLDLLGDFYPSVGVDGFGGGQR